jgi:hypothetical protein
MSKVLIGMLKFYLIFFIINSEVGFPCCIPEILTANQSWFCEYMLFFWGSCLRFSNVSCFEFHLFWKQLLCHYFVLLQLQNRWERRLFAARWWFQNGSYPFFNKIGSCLKSAVIYFYSSVPSSDLLSQLPKIQLAAFIFSFHLHPILLQEKWITKVI